MRLCFCSRNLRLFVIYFSLYEFYMQGFEICCVEDENMQARTNFELEMLIYEVVVV